MQNLQPASFCSLGAVICSSSISLLLYIHNTTELVAILDAGRKYNGQAIQPNRVYWVGVGGLNYIQTGYRLHTFSWVYIISVFHAGLQNNHHFFPPKSHTHTHSFSEGFFFLFSALLISSMEPFGVLFLTDTATFVSHPHSHISLHISSLSADLFIFLSLLFSAHALQPLTAGWLLCTRRENPTLTS